MTTKTPARYEEIADHLRRLVASSRPGDRLPSDAELCERFRVSRMTARQAVQTLSNERLLYRTRGKAPSWRRARFRGCWDLHCRSPKACGAGAWRLHRRSLHRERSAVGRGGQGAGSGTRRIRPAAGTAPVGRRHANGDRAGRLRPALRRGARRRSGARLAPRCLPGARMDPDPGRGGGDGAAATARERRLLQLGEPVVLAERRTISDQDGSPLEHTETVYAAERYVFAAVLHRGDRPAGVMARHLGLDLGGTNVKAVVLDGSELVGKRHVPHRCASGTTSRGGSARRGGALGHRPPRPGGDARSRDPGCSTRPTAGYSSSPTCRDHGRVTRCAPPGGNWEDRSI